MYVVDPAFQNQHVHWYKHDVGGPCFPDIRAKSEIERVGAYPKQYPTSHRWNTAIYAVPIIDAVPKYNAELGKKEYLQSPNKAGVGAS